MWEVMRYNRLGELMDKCYRDVGGVEEWTNSPDWVSNRSVHEIVLEIRSQHSDIVRTVIVASPTFQGK